MQGFDDFAVCAIDLEGSGDRFSIHPIVEVGAVVKLPDGRTWAKFSQLGRCGLDQYEPRCAVEFWDKVDPDCARRLVYSQAQEQAVLWRNFYDWIVQNTSPTKIVFVTDNPSFDAGAVNYNFDRYLNEISLRYIVGGNYTKNRDVHSALEPLAAIRNTPRKDFERELLDWYALNTPIVEKSDHTHLAFDDANHIANLWLAMNAYVKDCADNSGKFPF